VQLQVEKDKRVRETREEERNRIGKAEKEASQRTERRKDELKRE
jgi:hypothetical protein